MGAPLVAATAIIGGMVLAGTAGLARSLNHGLDKDPTAHVTPESLTPQVDTRAERRSIELIQHEITQRPGLRVRVTGTIDSDEALAKAKAFAGGFDGKFDNRNEINDGTIDDMLSSKLR